LSVLQLPASSLADFPPAGNRTRRSAI